MKVKVETNTINAIPFCGFYVFTEFLIILVFVNASMLVLKYYAMCVNSPSLNIDWRASLNIGGGLLYVRGKRSAKGVGIGQGAYLGY